MRDRHVLVTGGTGGLGAHVSAAFLRAGAKVTVPVYDTSETDRLTEVAGPDASKVLLVKADLADEDQVRRTFDGMKQVDAVVHLVGGFAMGEIDSFEIAALREQLELNVVTTFTVVKHAVRRMRPAGYGRIVTVGSQAAEQPTAKMAAYAAAKAGVVAITRAVADELRGTDITANCVLPSIIDTPANRAAMGEDDADQWVKPSRLAEQIVFLASEPAGDLRGTALRAYANV